LDTYLIHITYFFKKFNSYTT